MWAMVIKEFLQLRRDRRTLAMMILLPIMLLVVFGYAARFDVSKVRTLVVGPQATQVAAWLKSPFGPIQKDRSAGLTRAKDALRDGEATVAFVTGDTRPLVLIDGTDLFSARAVETALARMAQVKPAEPVGAPVAQTIAPQIQILYNPDLKTSDVMIPGLAGVILVFVGTMIASLGVVRERQAGTLEQLAVMPLSPWDVLLGKIAPYFAVAAVDLTVVIAIGMLVFGVPMRGSVLVLILGSLLFLFVTLGLGVLISSVSQNQGQAIQLAMMTVLPQILLSGLIFPLPSMAAGVRWIAYLLPLTYFVQIARDVMLKGTPIGALWQQFCLLALLGIVAVTLAAFRFRQFLAPAPAGRREKRPAEASS